MSDPVLLHQPQWDVLAQAAKGRGYEYDGYFSAVTAKLFDLDLVAHTKWGGKRYLVATDKGRAALKQGSK